MVNCIFKWVQVSDIHFRTVENEMANFNTSELKRELLIFLKKITGVDALLVTGDYRYAPDRENNPKNVADYLKQLGNSLSIDSSKIIIVPGNHDLKRGTTRTDVVKAEWGRYKPAQGSFDKERLETFQNGFDFFKGLSEALDYKAFQDQSNPHALVDMGECELLLLNTAITSCGKEDDHNLIVGCSYIQGLLHNATKPVIVMGHHGFELFNEDEKKKCTTFLEKEGAYLYLCGHSHTMWTTSYAEKGRQVNVGCLMQEDKTVIAGFTVGSLHSDGTVNIECYEWDIDNIKWVPKSGSDKKFVNLYEDRIKKNSEEVNVIVDIKKVEYPFTVEGYTLLGGRGIDGIKYHWEKNGKKVESLAFNKRLKESNEIDDMATSAYTVSTSYGCQLAATEQQCRFCETGRQKYRGNLLAEEIALQNIFMAEYDSNCLSFPNVKKNRREFAYMGQGEPGLNYPAVRQSILLTDYAMEMIDQSVSRYIISTCGITDFMPSLIEDINNKCYKNKVTLHFSLHAVDDERNIIMPINIEHNYKDFIRWCTKLREVSNEKIGVGILMFNNYHINGYADRHTLTPEKLEMILKQLDKDVFRIDLCDVNKTSLGNQASLSNENAKKLCEVYKSMGFEGKTFSSFGDNEQSGCGMLNSSVDSMNEIGKKTMEHFNTSVNLLNRAKEELARK